MVDACCDASVGGGGALYDMIGSEGDIIVCGGEYVDVGIGGFRVLPALFVPESNVFW